MYNSRTTRDDGVYPIQPLSFREILDRSTRLVREHAGVLVGIALLLYSPLAVLEELTRGIENPMQMPGGTLLFAALVLGIVGLFTPVAAGAITFAVARIHCGAPPSLAEACREGLHRMLPLLGTSLLVTAAVSIGFLLLVVPGILLGVAFMAATPVVVLERSAGATAMRRSRDLLRGQMLRAFGLLLCWCSGLVILALTVQGLLGALPVVGPLAGVLVQSVALAFYASLTTVLYLDAACRQEGLDVGLLARRCGVAISEPFSA